MLQFINPLPDLLYNFNSALQVRHAESVKSRNGWIWKGPPEVLWSKPLLFRATWSQLPRNIPVMETSLGNQGSVTLTVEKFSDVHRKTPFLCFSLWLLPLALALGTTERAWLWHLCTHPPCIYIHGWDPPEASLPQATQPHLSAFPPGEIFHGFRGRVQGKDRLPHSGSTLNAAQDAVSHLQGIIDDSWSTWGIPRSSSVKESMEIAEMECMDVDPER